MERNHSIAQHCIAYSIAQHSIAYSIALHNTHIESHNLQMHNIQTIMQSYKRYYVEGVAKICNICYMCIFCVNIYISHEYMNSLYLGVVIAPPCSSLLYQYIGQYSYITIYMRNNALNYVRRHVLYNNISTVVNKCV